MMLTLFLAVNAPAPATPSTDEDRTYCNLQCANVSCWFNPALLPAVRGTVSPQPLTQQRGAKNGDDILIATYDDHT